MKYIIILPLLGLLISKISFAMIDSPAAENNTVLDISHSLDSNIGYYSKFSNELILQVHNRGTATIKITQVEFLSQNDPSIYLEFCDVVQIGSDEEKPLVLKFHAFNEKREISIDEEISIAYLEGSKEFTVSWRIKKVINWIPVEDIEKAQQATCKPALDINDLTSNIGVHLSKFQNEIILPVFNRGTVPIEVTRVNFKNSMARSFDLVLSKPQRIRANGIEKLVLKLLAKETQGINLQEEILITYQDGSKTTTVPWLINKKVRWHSSSDIAKRQQNIIVTQEGNYTLFPDDTTKKIFRITVETKMIHI